MSSRKGSSGGGGGGASQGSKSQLLLALKEQVLQLQTQLREEREEREKISSWLTQTLKPRLKQQFEDMNGRLEETSDQVGRIRQFLRDHRAALTSSSSGAGGDDLDALKASVAIEHEARQQLSLWLKQKIGKNLERLDARYVRAGASGAVAAAVPPGVAPLPETVGEWLRVVGYERYAEQFERARVDSLEKVARLDDERLAKLGVDLKRHRGDLLHDIAALRQQLEQGAQASALPSTPVYPRTDDEDDDAPDPFSEDVLARHAAENREEADRRLAEERARLQKENERWREEERARLRRELEQEEERFRQKERDAAAKRLEEERHALEAQRRDVERQAERVKEEQERKRHEQERLDRQERERKKQEQEDERRRQRDKEDQEREQRRRDEDAAADRARKEREREEQERRERERKDKEREDKERRPASPRPSKEAPSYDDEADSDSEESAPPSKSQTGSSSSSTGGGGASRTSDKSFTELVDDVRDDTCDTNWVAFFFDKASNSIKLTGYGSKGHKELLAHLEDDKVQYAMLRAMDQKRRIKFIYIHWVGSKSHAFLKARSGTKKAEMLKLMGQFHVEMPAETKDDITKDAILSRLSAVSAVNF